MLPIFAEVRHLLVIHLWFTRWPLQPPYVLRPRWVKRPGDLDLLTVKVVPESRVMWATFVSIFVFLSLSVLDLCPMYTIDVRQKHRLVPPPIRGGGIIMLMLIIPLTVEVCCWNYVIRWAVRCARRSVCVDKVVALSCW